MLLLILCVFPRIYCFGNFSVAQYFNWFSKNVLAGFQRKASSIRNLNYCPLVEDIIVSKIVRKLDIET